MYTTGHIIIKREIKNWGWYRNPKVLAFWVHILIEANYQEGSWEGNELKRGELVTSLSQLSMDCGLTIQEVRHCLKVLGGVGEVRSRRCGRMSILTICNYDSYESVQQDENTLTTGSQHDILKEYNKGIKEEGKIKEKKNKESFSSEVEEIYSMYPTRCPMRSASTGKSTKDKKKILSVIKEVGYDKLRGTIKRYLEENFNKQYLMNFSTFLNNIPDYGDSVSVEPDGQLNIYGLVNPSSVRKPQEF